MIIFVVLFFSSYIDIKQKYVYCFFNLIFFIFGLIRYSNTDHPLLGFFVIPLTLVGINLIYQKEAIGYGDIEMIACAGFLLGYQKICMAFFIATFTNTIYSFFIQKKEYAFIPFLSIGIMISYLV